MARSQGLSVSTQVLTTLGFLATGAFQRELANQSGVCQSALSRAMPAVWDGIIRMSSSTARVRTQPVGRMSAAGVETSRPKEPVVTVETPWPAELVGGDAGAGGGVCALSWLIVYREIIKK